MGHVVTLKAAFAGTSDLWHTDNYLNLDGNNNSFGDKFCTTVANGGPCTSNCDALAECGQGSAPENFTCPLNVCCSQVNPLPLMS